MSNKNLRGRRLRPVWFRRLEYFLLACYIYSVVVSHAWYVASFLSFLMVGLAYLHFEVTRGSWK